MRHALSTAAQPIPSLEWYHIDDPSSPALDELALRFHLHELQIEDCRHRPQRAKSEEHAGYIFFVLKHLHANDGLNFDDLDVFLGRDFVISVSSQDSSFVEKVRQRAIQDNVQRLDRVFYILLDTVVDGYMPVLDGIAEETSELETDVLETPDPPTLRRIFVLKRKLIDFRRIASGMREVVNSVIRREGGLMGDDLDPYFRDIYDHLVRTVDLIETYRDLLTGSLDIYLSAVANRTNEVMKVLTVYGTVALPMVIITGFFGMNLHLPWTSNPHGALYAVGLMGISTLLILWYFRRKGWF
ncbi:MAG TPA: magnesium transporter CorA family protein [Clostridia bacterium]|nr:magnesium transporter CorA family protein [Clostridia bacterium]